MSVEILGSLADILTHLAFVQGDDVAQVYGPRCTSYRQLNSIANRIANGLVAHSGKPGMRVAVLAKNGDYQCELLFGAAKARSVLVFINWRLTAHEIAHILDDSEAVLVFVEKQFLNTITEAASELETKPQVIILDDEDEQHVSYIKWENAYPDQCSVHGQGPDQDVVQMYTSGTTGQPKGVVITNSNILAMLRQVTTAGWGKWEPSARQLVCMPLFHIGGISLALVALLQGCTNVILADAKIEAIIDAIVRYKIAKIFLVPSVLDMLSRELHTDPRDLSSLDLILYGASPISEALLVKLQGVLPCKFTQLYGMTELSGAVTYLPPEDHKPDRGKLRSCGMPNPGVQVRIADSSGEILPSLAVGEIYVKAKSVMKGYWRNQTATSETIRDGWLRTGDIGHLDAEGYLFIYDRAKDMIVCGAENIYPAEVENAIAGHPSVEDVAVIGVPDEKWGECVKAVVVIKEGCRLSFEELVAHLEGRIAGYKMPKSMDLAVKLPRTSTGKISKRQLREPYWNRMQREVN